MIDAEYINQSYCARYGVHRVQHGFIGVNDHDVVMMLGYEIPQILRTGFIDARQQQLHLRSCRVAQDNGDVAATSPFARITFENFGQVGRGDVLCAVGFVDDYGHLLRSAHALGQAYKDDSEDDETERFHTGITTTVSAFYAGTPQRVCITNVITSLYHLEQTPEQCSLYIRAVFCAIFLQNARYIATKLPFFVPKILVQHELAMLFRFKIQPATWSLHAATNKHSALSRWPA